MYVLNYIPFETKPGLDLNIYTSMLEIDRYCQNVT